jgi:hypothetical protein
MSQALGARGLISIEEEVAYKQDIASPDATKLYFKSESLKSERNLITSETITGSREATKPVRGNINVSGDITMELQAYMGLMLKAAFGEVVTASTELSYTTPSGEFSRGETVTDGSATATVVFDDTANGVLHLSGQSGTFAAGTITGSSSGSTATISGDSTAAADNYTHRFIIGTSVPSLVIDKGFSDISQYFKYQGCKVNSMSLSVVPEGFQDVTFSIIGAKETTGSSPYDSSPTDHGKSTFDGFSIATLKEGGSSIANVTTIDGLTLENNLDDSVYVIDPNNPGERAALPAGVVKVSGTLTAMFEDITLYNKAVNNTETNLRIAYKLGTGDGSDGNEYLEFFIPELIYSQSAPVIEGGSGVKVSLPFEAYYDNSAEATTIDCVLRNTISSY